MSYRFTWTSYDFAWISSHFIWPVQSFHSHFSASGFARPALRPSLRREPRGTAWVSGWMFRDGEWAFARKCIETHMLESVERHRKFEIVISFCVWDCVERHGTSIETYFGRKDVTNERTESRKLWTIGWGTNQQQQFAPGSSWNVRIVHRCLVVSANRPTRQSGSNGEAAWFQSKILFTHANEITETNKNKHLLQKGFNKHYSEM